MAECVILVGLPASGKSTFYRDYLAGTHDLVSKDLMRNGSGRDRRQQELITRSLAAGRSVAVDNTNPSRAARAPIIALARAHRAEVVGYYLPTDVSDALRRNRLRQGRDRVPEVAIFAKRKQLEPPSYEEGFDRLYVVTLNEQERSFDIRLQQSP